jgi:hypothetical protein
MIASFLVEPPGALVYRPFRKIERFLPDELCSGASHL